MGSNRDVIGYIPGTFDLFHVGHLRYLRNGKALCDRLIAAVLTDEVILGYKGEMPTIPFQQRAEIVRAIRYVDAVVECNTRNVYEEWGKLKFNIAFIGDDWYGDKEWLEWENKLTAKGVIIRYLPRNCNISTTKIKTSIKDKS